MVLTVQQLKEAAAVVAFVVSRIQRIGGQLEKVTLLLYNVANFVVEVAKVWVRRILRSYYTIYYTARSERLNYMM